MKKFLSLFAAILFVGSMWAADYTLTFPKMTSGTNYSSYTGAHTTTCGGIDWSVYGNQSLNGDILRIGGKNTTNTNRTITSSDPLTIPVTSVTINHLGTGNGANSEITVNSLKLEVADNSSFTDADVITKTELNLASAGSVVFTPTSGTHWAANSYYRVTMNYKVTITSGSSANNCYLVIKTIFFEEYLTTPFVKATPASLDLGTGFPGEDEEDFAKTFTLTGKNLTNPVKVIAPLGFVCSPIDVNPDGDGNINQVITVTPASTENIADFSGDINVKGTGENPDGIDTNLVACSFSVVAAPILITCAQAAIYAASVSENNELYNDGQYYKVQGYITNIDSYSGTSPFFWAADAADGGKVIEAYKPVQVGEGTVALGNRVEIIGQLTKYNTSNEFAAGCRFSILSSTALEDVESSVKAVKVLRDGMLYIEKNGKTYTAQGQLVP